jgi:hypothetical protein
MTAWGRGLNLPHFQKERTMLPDDPSVAKAAHYWATRYDAVRRDKEIGIDSLAELRAHTDWLFAQRKEDRTGELERLVSERFTSSPHLGMIAEEIEIMVQRAEKELQTIRWFLHVAPRPSEAAPGTAQ